MVVDGLAVRARESGACRSSRCPVCVCEEVSLGEDTGGVKGVRKGVTLSG